MLRILKQNDFLAAFVLVLLTFVLKAKYILHPPAISSIENFHQGMLFSFKSLIRFYTSHPSLYTIFSICLLLVFSFYFNWVINREKFLAQKTYLPAFSFILLTSFLPVFNIFSTVFIANCFLFIAFSKTMQLYHIGKPRRACFDIGLLVSLAALFYFPSILFFFLFLALLLLLRPFMLQENIAYILGILTPLYISFALLYITGHWGELNTLISLNITPPLKTIALVPLLVMTVTSITMIMYGLYLVNQAGFKNHISVRKKWNGVVIYLFFALIAGIFSITFPGVSWFIVMTPISIILSQTFLHNKEKYNTFTFYFLIAVVVFVQWLL